MPPILRALLLGDTHQLDPYDFFVLSRLGLGHTLSVSGFHMSSALLCALFLVRLWYRRRGIRYENAEKLCLWVLLLIAACLMTIMTRASGWASPALRSMLAITLVLAAPAWGIYLTLWARVLVSISLAILLGAGSWLSVVLSIFGVIGLLLSPKSQGAWGYLCWPWLCTNIISVLIFHQISLLSPLANLLFAIPLNLGVVLPTLFGYLVESCRGNPAYFYYFAEQLWRPQFWLMEKLAQWSCALLWVNQTKVLVVFAVLMVGYFFIRKRSLKNCFYALILAVSLGTSIPLPTLTALDIGQGDSLLLYKSKETFLLDTGPNAKQGPYPGAASVQIENLAIDNIQAILLSHPDADHAAGLRSILARHRVQELWLSAYALLDKKVFLPLQWAERYGVAVRIIQNREMPFLALECRTLARAFSGANDNSLLCRYEYAARQYALLTGDMSEKAERAWIAADPSFLTATILKVAHHGSASSSSELFLQSTNAKEAWISVGALNRYKHPRADTLARLSYFGIKIRRTDHDGNLSTSLLYPAQNEPQNEL